MPTIFIIIVILLVIITIFHEYHSNYKKNQILKDSRKINEIKKIMNNGQEPSDQIHTIKRNFHITIFEANNIYSAFSKDKQNKK